MRLKGTTGFSMIEMVIIIAIIVGLAGVVVPIVSQEVKDSKKARAVADINRIATALNQYIKDTLTFPTGKRGSTTLHYLYTDGKLPENNPYASGEGKHIHALLEKDEFSAKGWKGPYLQSVAADPWENAYMINVQGFYDPKERVMIISSGPDGRFDTSPDAATPQNDDLMLLID